MKLYDATCEITTTRTVHTIVRAETPKQAKMKAKRITRVKATATCKAYYPKVTVKEIADLYPAFDADGDPIWVTIPSN